MVAPLIGVLWALAEAIEAGIKAYARGDYVAAAREFLPLDVQGDASEQYWMGVMYFEGPGVPQHHSDAAEWYRRAAEHDHAHARGNLGIMYADGERNLPQDDVQACAWLHLSADRGSESVETARNYIAHRLPPQELIRALYQPFQYRKASAASPRD